MHFPLAKGDTAAYVREGLIALDHSVVGVADGEAVSLRALVVAPRRPASSDSWMAIA